MEPRLLRSSQGRIDRLRTLTELLRSIQTGPRPGATLSPEDLELLYEGLSLALSQANDGFFQRQVIRDVVTPTAAEDERANDLAANVATLLAELDHIVAGSPSGDDGATPTVPPAGPPSMDARYPVSLVLIRLQPELRPPRTRAA